MDTRRLFAHRSATWWGLVLAVFCLAITPPKFLKAQTAQPSEQQVVSILKQKCYQCHNNTVQMSNLNLESREALLKGSDKGPVITPGNAVTSRLFKRVSGAEMPRMPMAPVPALSAEEVAVLKAWIDGGAKLSDTAAAKPAVAVNGAKERVITDADRSWWAFRSPARPTVPKVAEARWSRNPIDSFVRKMLDDKGLKAAPEADRSTLIRRVYLDLTGLLPSPEETEAFVKDPAPNAYEKLVDRLLESPHYGERWGRFWLDVVRYADSSGFEHDRDNTNAWRYRDYVIKAFNKDKPFNRFVVEQLAGDELEDRDYDSLIATSYYRVGPRVRFREKDNPFYRYEYLDDLIRTTFQGFMGLSVNCARCHDHKFDPITRKDYYRSMAMMFSYVDYDHLLAPPNEVARYERAKKEIEDQIRPLRRQIALIEQPYRRATFEKRLSRLPEDIQLAFRTPEDKRTPGQKLLAAQVAGLDVDPDAAAAAAAANPLNPRPVVKVSEADDKVRAALNAQIDALRKKMPETPPVAEGIRDGDYRLTPDGPGDEPLPGKGTRFEYGVDCCFLPDKGRSYKVPPVFFASNGVVVEEDQKNEIVEPGFLKVLAKSTDRITHPPEDGTVSSGRRRALGEWIASAENPLTARVMINRVWHWHFGKGIVSTPGTFGKMGAQPTHPELLDWLATEFVGNGWSIKKMHRLIMNSETYKQSSAFYDSATAEKDPTNNYLWRFPLRRLEGETIRDVILSASGQLNLEAGGEPFFPSIPLSLRESYRQGKWEMTKEEPSTWRRGVYSYWKRGLKYPMFEVHDQPDVNVTCEKRNTTTVPTQALTLLNNEFVLIQARYLAERVLRAAGADAEKEIRALHRIALSRDPSAKEVAGFQTFLQKQRDYHRGRASKEVELAALTDMAHVMLNANEFVYLN